MNNIKQAETEYINTYTRFNTIEEALKRKDAVVNTVKNAITRENSTNEAFKLNVHDSVISSNKDGKYVLEIIIEKKFK